MAVVVSIARGHDASYPFKTTDAAEGPVITGQCGAGYYLSVVEEGGEPLRPGGSGFRVHLPARQQGPSDRRGPRESIARLSYRWALITKTALADPYEKDRGHAPDLRALASMRQFANAMTRRAKEPGALGLHRTAARLGDRARAWRAWDAARPRGNRMARSATQASTGARGDTRAELASRGELTHPPERAAMAVPCAARCGARATTDAATRGGSWRLDGRPG